MPLSGSPHGKSIIVRYYRTRHASKHAYQVRVGRHHGRVATANLGSRFVRVLDDYVCLLLAGSARARTSRDDVSVRSVKFSRATIPGRSVWSLARYPSGPIELY